MERNKENATKEEITWEKAENEVCKNIKSENFAKEIFREFKIQTRVVIIAMAFVLAIGAILYYKNDVGWRTLFNSCDFVSQGMESIDNIKDGE